MENSKDLPRRLMRLQPLFNQLLTELESNQITEDDLLARLRLVVNEEDFPLVFLLTNIGWTSVKKSFDLKITQCILALALQASESPETTEVVLTNFIFALDSHARNLRQDLEKVYELAHSLCGKLLTSDSENPAYRLASFEVYLALLKQDRLRLENSVKLYENRVELDRELDDEVSVDTTAGLAECFYLLGDFQQALALYRKIDGTNSDAMSEFDLTNELLQKRIEYCESRIGC